MIRVSIGIQLGSSVPLWPISLNSTSLNSSFCETDPINQLTNQLQPNNQTNTHHAKHTSTQHKLTGRGADTLTSLFILLLFFLGLARYICSFEPFSSPLGSVWFGCVVMGLCSSCCREIFDLAPPINPDEGQYIPILCTSLSITLLYSLLLSSLR